MNLQSFLSLENHTTLIAVRPGSIQGVTYEAGTIGVLERVKDPSEGSGKIIHFTRALAFDFAFLEKRNWEVLKHCAACSRSVIETDLKSCETCLRPDYCPQCVETHNCLVPSIGVSRKPRHNQLTKGR